jgi:UDP-N-acetylmuramate dehydrogenase
MEKTDDQEMPDLNLFLRALEEEGNRLIAALGPGETGEIGEAGEAGKALDYRFDEPMAAHTSFRIGGPADLWLRPRGDLFPPLAEFTLRRTAEEGIPLFILGGGANLLVSDRGIRGIVLDTGGWRGFRREGEGWYVKSGTSIEEMTGYAAGQGLSGLEFLAGMPGTLGGAVWMNARCYERSISDVLVETEVLDPRGIRRLARRAGDFGYKKSPFQGRRALILGAVLALNEGDAGKIRREMAEHLRDREQKGHYRYPSAGSAFKNNRAFGKPTGKIIDELGLRGFRVGEAQVACWHGNIVINRGGARAADIRALLDQVAARVREERGLELEREILLAGEWEDREMPNVDKDLGGYLY